MCIGSIRRHVFKRYHRIENGTNTNGTKPTSKDGFAPSMDGGYKSIKSYDDR
jgi:hypothetical protein